MSGRCKACNNILSDFEMTRKWADTLTYVDLCSSCFFKSTSAYTPVIEREDLMEVEDWVGLDEIEDGFN